MTGYFLLDLLLFLERKIDICLGISGQKITEMSVFGIVLFLLIGGMAFWMLLFLLGFVVPFWIHLGIMQQLRPKKVFEQEEENA